MSHLSNLLRRTRESSGVTLSEFSRKCGCPRQTLSNYERGASLPKRSWLNRISDWYNIPLDQLEGAYISSGPTVISGAYAEVPYEDALQTLGRDDHFVTVTQKSIVTEDRGVATFIAGMIAKGAWFSFVAYLPRRGSPDRTWHSNHREAAWTLSQELDLAGVSASSQKLQYILIGSPTPRDFAFLRAEGAIMMAARSERSRHEPFQAWSQLPTVDRERAWVPSNETLVGELRHWLTFECGIELPRRKAKAVKRATRSRQLRHLTLEELLGK